MKYRAHGNKVIQISLWEEALTTRNGMPSSGMPGGGEICQANSPDSAEMIVAALNRPDADPTDENLRAEIADLRSRLDALEIELDGVRGDGERKLGELRQRIAAAQRALS